jgi:hypothetical protein
MTKRPTDPQTTRPPSKSPTNVAVSRLAYFPFGPRGSIVSGRQMNDIHALTERRGVARFLSLNNASFRLW